MASGGDGGDGSDGANTSVGANANTCVAQLLGLSPSAAAPAVTPQVAVCIACIVADLLLWCYAHQVQFRRPSQHASEGEDATARPAPDYGLGGHHVVKMLALIGALLSITQPTLWFLFRATNLELACQAQAGQFGGVPVFPPTFVLLCILLIAFNAARTRLRFSLTNSLPLGGARHVLLLQCYRAVYATALARRLPDGVVVGADAYGTDLQPESDEWARENCAREGLRVTPADAPDTRVGDRVRIVNLGAGGYKRLPFADGAFDVVFVPFFSRMAYLQDEAEPAAVRRRKLNGLLRECSRILTPRGRLMATNLVWSAPAFEAAAREAAFDDGTPCFDGVVTAPRHFCLTMIPSKLTICTMSAKERRHSAVRLGSISSSGTSLVDRGRRRGSDGSAAEVGSGGDDGSSVGADGDAHTALRVVCCALLAGTLAAGAWATARWWSALQWPSELPWSNRVANAAVGVVWLAPLTVYYCWGELRAACADARPTGAEVVRVFAVAWLQCVLGLSVVNAFLWAPSAGIDIAIMRWANKSAAQLDSVLLDVNIALGLVTWYATYRVGRCVYERQRLAEGRRAAEAEAERRSSSPAEERPLLAAVEVGP